MPDAGASRKRHSALPNSEPFNDFQALIIEAFKRILEAGAMYWVTRASQTRPGMRQSRLQEFFPRRFAPPFRDAAAFADAG